MLYRVWSLSCAKRLCKYGSVMPFFYSDNSGNSDNYDSTYASNQALGYFYIMCMLNMRSKYAAPSIQDLNRCLQ